MMTIKMKVVCRLLGKVAVEGYRGTIATRLPVVSLGRRFRTSTTVGTGNKDVDANKAGEIEEIKPVGKPYSSLDDDGKLYAKCSPKQGKQLFF